MMNDEVFLLVFLLCKRITAHMRNFTVLFRVNSLDDFLYFFAVKNVIQMKMLIRLIQVQVSCRCRDFIQLIIKKAHHESKSEQFYLI